MGHLKDELMPRYAKLIYNGFWFSPERQMLQAAIDYSQQDVTGVVRLKLYKGNTMVIGRKAERSLFSADWVTFEESQVADYDQKDAAGFLKQIGRASCRESVWQYGSISVGAVELKKKNN